MPQPYTPKGGNVTYSADAFLSRPALAAHVSFIAGLMNEVDFALGSLLALLLGAKGARAETAIAMYLKISSPPARKAALLGAAETMLNRDDLQMLFASCDVSSTESYTRIIAFWKSSNC
jgi:hypothetical protein